MAGHPGPRPPRVAASLLAAALLLTACSASTSASPTPSTEELAAPTPSSTTPATPSAGPEGPSVAPAPPVPSPTPTADATPPPPDRRALVGRLAAATEVLPAELELSLVVLDPEGRVVFGIDPDRTLLPASTAKLLTGAAALTRFGPDHRVPTTVRHTGELAGGVLTGSIVLEGGGDPAMSSEDYRRYVYLARPHTELEALADVVVDAGVERVVGGVAVAPDLFGDAPEAPGWKDSYVPLLEARRTYALTVDAGMQVTVLQPSPDVELEILPAEDPRLAATTRVTEELRARGVSVSHEPWVRDGRLLPEGVVDVASLPVLGVVESPPLQDLVRFAFERSDNHISDTLFRLVGADAGADDWVTSGRIVAAEVAALGVDTTGLVLTDGSGLSRSHRVSATHLADVDRVMRAGPLGAQWRDALAVAGEEGTLRRRLRGTVAEGRFLGKTGTLDDVTAVAGTVEGPDGDAAYHVAAIANLPPSIGRWTALVAFDDVIALLAEDAAGCVRIPPPVDPDAPSPEPSEVVGGLSVSCPGDAGGGDDDGGATG